MKVTKVTAFRADDETLWSTESDAVEQNINNALINIDFSSDDTHSSREQKLKVWFKNNKADVRFILNNIDKLKL
jgi:hypothetical protein